MKVLLRSLLLLAVPLLAAQSSEAPARPQDAGPASASPRWWAASAAGGREGLFLSSHLSRASAPSGSPRWSWATESDVLPVATGGWYLSLATGRHLWRLRAVAAEIEVPDTFAPRGWKDARTRAQALLADRFFRPGFTGPWVGAGLERWEEELAWSGGPRHAHLRSVQATCGAGWVLPLGRGFYANPWVAVHQRIAGDRTASGAPARCHPKPLQAEASLKIGFAF